MNRASHQPTIIVIFGATGDLAQRKLLPALFHLYSNGYLPQKTRILGLSKDHNDSSSFRKFARNVIERSVHQHRAEELSEFLTTLDYLTGEFENKELYRKIAQELAAIDEREFKLCSNKLFYLAVPPVAYDHIFDQLARSGLTIPCGDSEGWTRVLVEKPFGKDLVTAQALDRKLGKLFQEEQIFRIDHYLAKETVQNIITFRFANALFEPVWNREYIDHVKITLWEKFGVGQRGSFYEDVGALRDVGQNHLLQMLALIAMEDPIKLEADAIRSARQKVLDQLKPLSRQQIRGSVTRGQYQGYREEQEVAAESETETFFRLTAQVNNKRWRGVPFILESGKKMAAQKVEIKVTFKEKESCVCSPDDKQIHQNVLTIHLQPDEGISLVFWAKKPGLEHELEPKTLSFFYKDSDLQQELPSAYEKVLYDCIRGDQTLFTSTEEVSAAWRFISPILKTWSNVPLIEYQPGSQGPT
ncbi:glucose-6-phosphate dehydrogenase [Patescibacteria group bacterium]|nr:glucose-6-phosphate dehydrogenase [Patescibacteria group bacterium]